MSIVSVHSAGLTHCGNVRDENQDQYVIAEMRPRDDGQIIGTVYVRRHASFGRTLLQRYC